ncbi:hypothetical protein V6N12_045952 [Hibiscus sabdariffa]|uniref:Uncharacterized protein n=1 Tax=Hibiscus sabdariffa TaxID=183260 RepID=A0ABR2G477_9ROSI
MRLKLKGRVHQKRDQWGVKGEGKTRHATLKRSHPQKLETIKNERVRLVGSHGHQSREKKSELRVLFATFFLPLKYLPDTEEQKLLKKDHQSSAQKTPKFDFL